MKYLIISCLFLFSCTIVQTETMKVVKDCTGIYVQIEGKDYQVCNEGILADYEDGSKINGSFQKVETCPDFADKIVCMMYHQNEGLVRFTLE